MPLGNIGDQFEYYQNVNLKDNTLQVGGVGTKPQETITRQANTTQYNITDVLLSGGSSMLQFNVLQSAGKSSWAIGGILTYIYSAVDLPYQQIIQNSDQIIMNYYSILVQLVFLLGKYLEIVHTVMVQLKHQYY